MGDLLPADLDVLLRAEAPLLDARLVLLVQLVEVEVEVARRADQLDGHVDQPEAERAAPQRARHQRPRSDARLERGHQVVAVLGLLLRGEVDLLALGLALDQRRAPPRGRCPRSPRGRTPRRSDSTSCVAISTSRFDGLRAGRSISSSPPSTTSSWKRSVCSASTSSSARTATRYSRSWKVKRPMPARPLREAPRGAAGRRPRRRARRRSRSSRRRPGRCRPRRRTPRGGRPCRGRRRPP